MPHIHTLPGQHDHTVTAYIVRTDTPSPQALLHMHRTLQILLPVGGHIELDETPWQSLAHEVAEESGYRLDELALLQPASRIAHLSSAVLHPYPIVCNTHVVKDQHYHSDTSYALVATGAPSQLPSEGESQDLRWLTLQELEALSNAEVTPAAQEVYRFILREALENWQHVSPAQFAL